jgi:anti-anti-sigma factor
VSMLVVRTFPMPVATLVAISGEVDIATVAELREHLRAIPGRHTVVEMSGVELLSAAGLTALLELRDRLARVGARVVLAAGPACVRRVLTVSGLDVELALAPTVEDAVTALTSGVTGKRVSRRARTTISSCVAARRYRILRESATGPPRPVHD